MKKREFLPIKRVLAGTGDFHKNLPGGGSFKPLVEVDSRFLKQRLAEVEAIGHSNKASIEKWGKTPSVAVLKLRNNAVAKTKRPLSIFNESTCPIIGGATLGTYYVSVTAKGLDRLRDAIINAANSEQQVPYLSTIESLRPYTTEDVLSGLSLKGLVRIGRESILRLVLFDHQDNRKDQLLRTSLAKAMSSPKSKVRPLHYGPGLSVYEYRAGSKDDLVNLASFPGSRLLGPFPQYQVVRTATRILGSLPVSRMPLPDENSRYPIVGQIDTGTDTGNERLKAWVADRWDAVPVDQQHNGHGSFVGGLICAGKKLNHDDSRFPSVSARIVDVVAFDKTEMVSEQTLLMIIRQAVRKFPTVKVWNLSFSVTTSVCKDGEFSPFGLALSEIAEEKEVIFVIAAGNTPELRGWPRDKTDDVTERVCAPADSPTGIVVGAVTHRATESSCVKENDPSPFSRRGPGAAYLLAPHVAHVGGNCDDSGDATQTGVLSVDSIGNLAEDIGTSFSTPLTSALVAGVHDRVRNETRADILSKAMLLHSTLLNNTPLSAESLNHVGLGLPPDIDTITHCHQSSATVVFSVNMSKGPNFIKEHFPIPKCLVSNGSLKAQIAMTLAYSPPLNPQAGAECCLTNVSAKLGTLHPKTGEFGYAIHRYPKKPEGQYEADLVKHGYKWSPFKFYYRDFNRKNTLGDRTWELRLNIERRGELSTVPSSHYAYILVTIRGKDKDGTPLPVYDELVVEMDRLGWSAENLELESQIIN